VKQAWPSGNSKNGNSIQQHFFDVRVPMSEPARAW
jgi:hypothetical protein